MRHAAVEFRSEHYLTINGEAPANHYDPLFRAYGTGDGGFVRLHMNFPHHRDAVLKLLGCAPTREAIESALGKWDAVAFETEAYRRGCVVAAMRTPEQWAQASAGGGSCRRAGGADRKDRRSAGTAAASRLAAAVGSSRA